VGELGDVNQAVPIGQDFHESTKVGHPAYHAIVHLADFRLRGEPFDDLHRFTQAFFVIGRHVDGAIIFHVDVCPGLVDDAFNGLATGADDGSDLIGFDLERYDTRRKLV